MGNIGSVINLTYNSANSKSGEVDFAIADTEEIVLRRPLANAINDAVYNDCCANMNETEKMNGKLYNFKDEGAEGWVDELLLECSEHLKGDLKATGENIRPEIGASMATTEMPIIEPVGIWIYPAIQPKGHKAMAFFKLNPIN